MVSRLLRRRQVVRGQTRQPILHVWQCHCNTCQFQHPLDVRARHAEELYLPKEHTPHRGQELRLKLALDQVRAIAEEGVGVHLLGVAGQHGLDFDGDELLPAWLKLVQAMGGGDIPRRRASNALAHLVTPPPSHAYAPSIAVRRQQRREHTPILLAQDVLGELRVPTLR